MVSYAVGGVTITPFDILLLPLIAFFIGIIASMTGVGGGVFIVPFLSLKFDISTHQAVGTSLATIVFTSLSSTLRYSKQRRIDYKVGLILTIATIPGAIVGAHLTTIITERLLGVIFGLFLLLIALRMALQFSFSKYRVTLVRRGWHRKISNSEGTIFEYDTNVLLGLALSFFGGLSSGLLGIGGGALIVPIMYLTMNFPMHITVATSMFIMIFTSVFGTTTHLSLGNVLFNYAILLSVGVVFGAQLGAYFSKRIPEKNLRRIFGVVIFFVGIRMILKYMYIE